MGRRGSPPALRAGEAAGAAAAAVQVSRGRGAAICMRFACLQLLCRPLSDMRQLSRAVFKPPGAREARQHPRQSQQLLQSTHLQAALTPRHRLQPARPSRRCSVKLRSCCRASGMFRCALGKMRKRTNPRARPGLGGRGPPPPAHAPFRRTSLLFRHCQTAPL